MKNNICVDYHEFSKIFTKFLLILLKKAVIKNKSWSQNTELSKSVVASRSSSCFLTELVTKS